MESTNSLIGRGKNSEPLVVVDTELDGVTYTHAASLPVLLTSNTEYDPESRIHRPAFVAFAISNKRTDPPSPFPYFMAKDWNGAAC